ncbi:MAG: DUF4468 domain-containing protein [Acidobacteriota bacterium]
MTRDHVRAWVVLVMLTVLCGAKEPEPAPPTDKATGRFLYQGVVDLNGVTATDLQARARAWVATVYRSGRDVVQLDDTQAGRIIAKGNFTIPWLTETARVHHTLTIEFKDGRYRYTLTDFLFQGSQWPEPVPLEDKKGQDFGWGKVMSRVAARAESLLSDFKAAMTRTSLVGDDKW